MYLSTEGDVSQQQISHRDRILQSLLQPKKQKEARKKERVSESDPSVPDQDQRRLNQEEYTSAVLDVLLRSDQTQKKKSTTIVKRQLERFEKTKELYEQKKAERVKEIESAQIQECTFKPEIKKNLQRVGSAGSKPRRFEDFLKAQEEHKRKVEEKIRKEQEEKAELKDEEVRDLQINPKSRDLVEKKRLTAQTKFKGSPPLDTFERLFQRKQAPHIQEALQRKTASSLTRTSQSRTPKSEKKNQESRKLMSRINQRKGITSHLYQDALRRQKKQEEQKSKKKEEKNAVASQKSQQVLRSRFVKDFREAVEVCVSRSAQLFGSRGAEKTTQMVNFMQFQQILRVLGYVRDQEEEKLLVHKMWTVIARSKEASLRDIQTFLESVQGVLMVQEKREAPFGDLLRQNETKTEKKRECFGHFEEGVFQVSEKELRKIQRQFTLLSSNRKDFVFAQKAMNKEKSGADCSFHPTVNSESQRIVRSLEFQKNTIARLAKMPEIKAKPEQPDLNCTFKPMTNACLKERSSSGGAHKKRWEALYQNAKTMSNRQERREKLRDEERGIKEKQECTFRPQLLTKSKTFDKRGTDADNRDIEEFVRRMEKAREKNAAVKQAQEKGWTLERVIRGSVSSKIPEQLRTKPKTRRVIKKEKPKEEEQQSHATIPESAIELPTHNSDKQFDLENSQLEQLLEIADKSPKQEEKKHLEPEQVQRIQKALEADDPAEPFEPPLEEEVNLPPSQEDFSVPTHELQRKVSGLRPSELHGEIQLTEESEREPVLYVDVNLGSGVSKRITVFEGDTAQELAQKFAEEHSLDDGTREKLTKLLQSQMSQLLTKIEQGESEDFESQKEEEEALEDSLPSGEEGYEAQAIEQKYLSPESGSECIKEQIQSDMSNGQASPQHNQSESESVAVVSPMKIKF